MARISVQDREAKLLKEREEIDARLTQLRAKHKQQERKLDTRRKIILGGAILAWLEKNPDKNDWVADALSSITMPDRDRALLASILKHETGQSVE
jgi:hypothetical protein